LFIYKNAEATGVNRFFWSFTDDFVYEQVH